MILRPGLGGQVGGKALGCHALAIVANVLQQHCKSLQYGVSLLRLFAPSSTDDRLRPLSLSSIWIWDPSPVVGTN